MAKSESPGWWQVPTVEAVSEAQIGTDPLSDLVICGRHVATCCVTGTMHIWWHDDDLNDEKPVEDQNVTNETNETEPNAGNASSTS